ncbi:hypothetical protein ACHAXT_005885 [Thalassiosira profunda]
MAYKRRQSSRTKASAATAKPGKAASKSRHYTRPGVEAAVQLVSLQPLSDHVAKWERAASSYPAMIKAKGGTKLVKLDKQRENWANKGESAVLTKDELLDVMIQWKFLKGKPRNALKPLLNANSDAAVVAAAQGAFEAAKEIPLNDESGEYNEQITLAMKELCTLSGVGPATASAILCLHRPDVFAFMDDEVIEALYEGKRGYTLKIYLEVNDRCRDLATELNEASNRDNGWTPCKVGKALWAVATMSATNDEDGFSAIFDDDDDIKGCGSNEENGDTRNSHKRAKKG